MPYLKCQMCHELSLHAYACLGRVEVHETVSIFVNKRSTRFVWFDTFKLLMFRVKFSEKNDLFRKCINHRNSFKLGFPFGQ